MKNYISFNFSRYKLVDFLVSMDTIIKHMTDNPNFPNPPFSMPHLIALLTNLRLILEKPKQQISTADRKTIKKIRTEMEEKVALNGRYIQLLFPGDMEKQQSAGYPLAKERDYSNEGPEVPGNVRVRRGKKSGEVVFNCDKKPKTKILEIQYHIDELGAEVKTHVSTSGRGVVISGLTPGKWYIFRVRAVGKSTVPPSDWSGKVRLLVA